MATEMPWVCLEGRSRTNFPRQRFHSHLCYQIVRYFCRTLYKSGAVWSVDWIFITGAPAWRWLGEYVTMDSTFYSLFFQAGNSNSPSYFRTFFLITFFEEDFIRNILLIIILCIYNNAINNNTNVKLQGLILPFKIPRDTRKNLFQIYSKFGRATSKSLPALP
jgi:hypothetical protein